MNDADGIVLLTTIVIRAVAPKVRQAAVSSCDGWCRANPQRVKGLWTCETDECVRLKARPLPRRYLSNADKIGGTHAIERNH